MYSDWEIVGEWSTNYVRFSRQLTMKNAVFWDVAPRGIGGTDVSEELIAS
jgi:hypothetical protein